MTDSKLPIQDMCSISLYTAVIAIMAQISIPMPLGVPMTMQTFAIMLAAITLGAKKGAAAALIYMLLGAMGLPIFSNFTGGFQCLAGPTGGFIISFPLMAYIIGLGAEHFRHAASASSRFILFLIAGITVNYTAGLLMFAFATGSSLMTSFTVCVLPFIPTEIIKMVLASVLGLKIRRRLDVMLRS